MTWMWPLGYWELKLLWPPSFRQSRKRVEEGWSGGVPRSHCGLCHSPSSQLSTGVAITSLTLSRVTVATSDRLLGTTLHQGTLLNCSNLEVQKKKRHRGLGGGLVLGRGKLRFYPILKSSQRVLAK